MKILVVENERSLCETIEESLLKEDYAVETVFDYKSALEKIESFSYDCILLDIGLPGGSGLDLLKEITEEKTKSGVIIISAKDSIDDKIKGLNLGADDYISKPFHLAEMHARIKSVIRRKFLNGQTTLETGNVCIDIEARSVAVDQVELPLNRKEFDVLYYLALNKDRLVSKSALANQVWGDYIDDASSFDFIYSQIKNLRKKLGESKAGIEIQAVYGIGYKLTER